MAGARTIQLLTINTGSSSLKAACYRMGDGERRALTVEAERIGHTGGHICITDADGAAVLDEARDLPDHGAALATLLDWLRAHPAVGAFEAVGHRVVHGGPRYRAPHRITPALVAALRDLTAIDPDHLPQAIAAIEAVSRAHPEVPQVACFDTVFHRHMPAVAQRYALPRKYSEQGVIRYGFHGLSYEYIMDALRHADAHAAAGRVIVAHLGNGASMAAVRDGVGIETTMGFSPTGGLVMGTRVGDLDPSVPFYLMRSAGLSADDASALLNTKAGMLAVSETSGDMRDLLDKESSDPRAAEAVALFCYQAKKCIGALAAALGGLDTLVFTGGIGEHAAPVRARICVGLEFLGIGVDPERNAAHAAVISPDDAAVAVRVIPTDEDLMIARHTYALVSNEGKFGVRSTKFED